MSSKVNKRTKRKATVNPVENDSKVEENVVSMNTAIDHLLRAINALNIHKQKGFPTFGDNTNNVIRNEIFEALGILRTMTGNKDYRMHINKLPDNCLVKIFKKGFSLQTQLSQLRPVCHHWKKVIETLVCEPEQSLKLFGSSGTVNSYCGKLIELNMFRDEKFKLNKIGKNDHDLILSRLFTPNFGGPVEFLGTIFTNVQHLVLCFNAGESSNLDSIANLIRQWPNLRHLSLYVPFYQKDSKLENFTSTSICQAINSLKELKHLDVLGGVSGLNDIVNQLNLVWPRLERFSLDSRKKPDYSAKILKKLSLNCKEIRLNCLDISIDSLKSLFTLKQATSLTVLRLSSVKADLEIIKLVCKMFSQLTSLELKFASSWNEKESFPLDATLLNNINKLTHLRELSLKHLKIDLDSFKLKKDLPRQASSVTSLNLSSLWVFPKDTNGSKFISLLAKMFS